MSNLSNFDSNIVDDVNFNSTIVSITTFDSTLSYQDYYAVVLDNVSQTTSWFVKFIQTSNIQISSINIAKSLVANFDSGANVMTIIQDGIASLSPILSFTQNSQMIVVPTVSQFDDTIVFYSTSTMNAVVSRVVKISDFVFTSSSMVMTIEPISSQYYLVSDWDASLLSDLDANLLIVMDYQNT